MNKYNKNSVYKALFAHVFSKYDVFLFGFLAPIIKPIFFVGSEFIITLSVFATFAAGYIIRPLGAIFFSHIGDKIGRKFAFMLTVLLMAVPTVLIGILPGYEYIGIAAPIILILCRLIHGFCSGGEFSGLAVYVTEFVPKEKLGLFAGIVRSVGFLGTALGTLIAAFMTLSFMPYWGWRLTFIIGAILTLFSFYLRKNMSETPDFEEIKDANKISEAPFFEIIKNYKKQLLAGFAISSCAYIFLYTTTVYLSSLYTDLIKVSNSLSLTLSTITMIIWMLMTPLGGLLADKIGFIKYLTNVIIATACIIFPLYYFTFLVPTLKSLFLLQTVLSILGSLIFAPVPGFLKQMFPTSVRFSGVAVSNTTAQALLGGLAPMYSAILISLTNLNYSPAFLLIFACILGYIGLKQCYKYIPVSVA